MEKYDFLVIGGGSAGLTYALNVAKKGSVAVLFKKDFLESSTSRAQGGIAAVTNPDDDFTLHIEDTLVAGAGLCNRETVEIVVREGPERIRELIEMGARFDKIDNRHFHLHREGGHSRRRIYHMADGTGLEIQETLINAVKKVGNIHLIPHANAVDLITTKKLGIENGGPNRVLGAYVLLPSGKIKAFVAEKTLVSAGGAGKVYLYTSNPDVASGDGIAMCYRAGVPVANMEFFQFHPTCLFHPEAKSFLITEAMRGEGAILKRINNEPFMHKYHPDKELAPRDVVARAIDSEMKLHGEDHVLLDIRHRGAAFVKEHFPNIYQECLKYGFDISVDPIPVVPAAHYCCGGVVTDEYGRTNLKDLYVAGETAHTGLHGANRLASNSLLEAVVYGYRAAEDSIKTFERTELEAKIPLWDPGSSVDSDEAVVISQNWDEVRRLMSNYVGIVRTDKRLERAWRRIHLIREEIKEYYWNFTITSDLLELRNLSLVAELIIKAARARKESRGLHFNLDYPELSDTFLKDTILTPSRTTSETPNGERAQR